MEIEDIQDEPVSNKPEDKLFAKLIALNDAKQFDECYSTALTIEALYKDNLAILVKLFEFYKEHNHIDMSFNLCSTCLFKRGFDFIKQSQFDIHLKRFAQSIIQNLLVRTSTARMHKVLADVSEHELSFYFKIFSRLDNIAQEKLVVRLLDKLKHDFGFLKAYLEQTGQEKGKQPTSQTLIDIKDFYVNLIRNKENLFLLRDLLLVYRKFIPDYGLFLIDGFFNTEKHLYANLAQNNSGDEILSIEKRSLNLMRRICAVELIPEFVYLVDKLENRHCYRWIEKSLEFFTKYAIAATEIKICENSETFEFNYTKLMLFNDTELSIADCKSEEKEKVLCQIKTELKEICEYAYTPSNILTGVNSSPFYNVYKLLDEVGKKLEWPNIPQWNSMDIEQKMATLFELKQKNEKSISISALNKQISFYGLTFFFHKLTEFQTLAKVAFKDYLIFAPVFEASSTTQVESKAPIVLESFNRSDKLLEICLSNLIFSLELWRKFNQHKEFLTIITKCLNNSKSDGIAYFKSFIADYYNSYVLATSNTINSNMSWTTVTTLPLRQRISNIAYLFFYEKSSFQSFFSELSLLLNDLEKEDLNKREKFHGSVLFFKSHFEIFELSRTNVLQYFSKIIGEKLNQMIDNKKPQFSSLLNKNDAYIGLVLVLLQPSLSRNSNSNVYQTIFQLLKTKTSFSWTQFFECIYDIQILQDFYMNLNAPSIKKFKLTDNDEIESELSKKILDHVNNENKRKKLEFLSALISKSSDILINLFDQIIKI